MNWYLDVLKKKYADFSGRAHRTEFWMFALFNFIIAVVLAIVDSFITGGLLYGLYALGVLIPSIAVGARRLHDTDKSGWMLLLGIIPLVNLVLIYFFVIDSQPGPNKYGPNPKGVNA